MLAAARFKRRDYAITCLLLDAGLRAFEACGLRAVDVNADEDWVKVMGKGAKERIVPLGKRTRKTLLTYVLNERPRGPVRTTSSWDMTEARSRPTRSGRSWTGSSAAPA